MIPKILHLTWKTTEIPAKYQKFYASMKSFHPGWEIRVWTDDMMEKFDKRRELIVNGLNSLPGIKCNNPGGAFYTFPNVSETGMSGDTFAEKCLYDAGVALVPGTSFGKSCTNFVRFSFANSYENIEKALEKIKKIL